MRPRLTHGLMWHRGMTGYMLRATLNPDRSRRDDISEHAPQRYKGWKPAGARCRRRLDAEHDSPARSRQAKGHALESLYYFPGKPVESDIFAMVLGCLQYAQRMGR